MKYSDFSTNSKYKGWISGPVMNPELSIKNIPNQNFYDWSTPVYGENGNLLYSGETPVIDGNKLFDKNYSNTIPTGATKNTNNTASKLSGINFAAGVEPTAELIGSMLDRNYRNPMKYAELENYANQGNVDSFNALENVYANLDKAPTASKMDFNGIDGKGWIDNWLKDTAAGASLGTSIAPGWGTLIGAIAGTANGLIRSGIQAGKSNKAYNDYLLAQEKANERLMANLNNSYHNAAMNEYNNLLSNMAAFGGKLNRFDMGGDISNGVNLIDSGSTHELNPYEGVQQGVDSQGIPNMVEEGEVIWEDEDYVFSNRLKLPKVGKKKSDDETKEEKFNRLYEGKTFAEVAERLQRESKERPNSSISKDTMNDNLSMLRNLQEEVKMKKQADEFKQEIANMSPEELMGLQQMLDSMGQQGMEQPMPEQIPQEGMMPQGMPDMGMAVNPAMMGQSMMACGGKLKRFDYGGNLFPDGGVSNEIEVQSNNRTPIIKRSYADALNYRGEFYNQITNELLGKYLSALEKGDSKLYNNLISGKYDGNFNQEYIVNEGKKDEFRTTVAERIKTFINNCITGTNFVNDKVEKAVKEANKEYIEKLKSEGYTDDEIKEYIQPTFSKDLFNKVNIRFNEKGTGVNSSTGENNYIMAELNYTKDDLNNGKLENIMKDLPEGIQLSFGYRDGDDEVGSHYVLNHHGNNGKMQYWEANDRSVPEGWIAANKYSEPTKGAHYSNIERIGRIPNSGEHEGIGRVKIMIPILDGYSREDADDFVKALQFKHPEFTLNDVSFDEDIDESTGMPVKSGDMFKGSMNTNKGYWKNRILQEDKIDVDNPIKSRMNMPSIDTIPTNIDDMNTARIMLSPYGNNILAMGEGKYPDGGDFDVLLETDRPSVDYFRVPTLFDKYRTMESTEPDFSRWKPLEPSYPYKNILPEVTVKPDSYKKKTHPWWNDQWNNFKTAVTNEDWRLHAPEYATALGLAHEYLRDKSKDFAEEVNFARHITEPNISYRPTGTKASYTPESSLAILDRLSAMSAASRNSLMNLSNASRAAKAMYNAMNDMRYFDTLGQVSRQLREQNNAEYLKRLEANNAIDAQNAMGDLQAASTNAQLKNSQLASWSHLMDTLNAEALQRDTAKGAMATHLPELISEHAKDEIKNKMLKEMAERGSLLYYFDPRYEMNYSGNNTAALGGYIDVRPLDKRTKKNRK